MESKTGQMIDELADRLPPLDKLLLAVAKTEGDPMTCKICGARHTGECPVPRFGDLCLTGWHGFSRQRVEIVGQTPKKYRIRALEDRTRLAGRLRWINKGETILVPKHAVRAPKER